MAYNIDMMKLKNIRNKSGLSQSAFADRHNIPLRTLQQWEQGRRNPPSYVIANIIEKEKTMSLVRNYKIVSKKNFKICITDPYENCNKIYPIQQMRIKNILDQVSQDKDISKVIVFGSSVTNRCHIDSDLDLFLEIDKNKNIIFSNIDYNLDLWNNFTVTDDLLKEIKEKGVVVYER